MKRIERNFTEETLRDLIENPKITAKDIENFIEKTNVNLNYKFEDKATFLRLAMRRKNQKNEIIKCLIKKSEELKEKFFESLISNVRNTPKDINYYIEEGLLKVNHTYKSGLNLLQSAAIMNNNKHSSMPKIKCLLENGADILAPAIGHNNQTALSFSRLTFFGDKGGVNYVLELIAKFENLIYSSNLLQPVPSDDSLKNYFRYSPEEEKKYNKLIIEILEKRIARDIDNIEAYISKIPEIILCIKELKEENYQVDEFYKIFDILEKTLNDKICNSESIIDLQNNLQKFYHLLKDLDIIEVEEFAAFHSTKEIIKNLCSEDSDVLNLFSLAASKVHYGKINNVPLEIKNKYESLPQVLKNFNEEEQNVEVLGEDSFGETNNNLLNIE